MAHRRIALDPRELPRMVCALKGAGLGPIAWLDGDGSSPLGRFSYVGVGPTRALRDWAELGAWLGALAPTAGDEPEVVCAAPAHTLALSYDLAWSMPIGVRRAPRLARSVDAPDAWVLSHEATIAADHERGEVWLLAEDTGALDRIESTLAREHTPHASLGEITSEPRSVHREAIVRALEDIGRGDVYQVNLARRFDASIEGDPLALALAMREASPVPLGLYLEGPVGSGQTLVSRTMERFLSFDARTRQLETRPIKGTRAREAGGDALARDALLADDKERAEHAMIVDLMRNDLGRVAETGSVRVCEAMRVEPYARLSHLVSVVEARARGDVSLAELLLATFPPGSVTGAPKLAAIERIEAYERTPRGFYTGAMGHIARDGSLSLAVAIRTAQIRDREVTYFAGGGIVEASDPEREVDETDLKAKVLLDASDILGRSAR
jgi:para-aminobenzoate synthetase component 1